MRPGYKPGRFYDNSLYHGNEEGKTIIKTIYKKFNRFINPSR